MKIIVTKTVQLDLIEDTILKRAAEILEKMSVDAEDYDDDLSQTIWDIRGSILELLDMNGNTINE